MISLRPEPVYLIMTFEISHSHFWFFFKKTCATISAQLASVNLNNISTCSMSMLPHILLLSPSCVYTVVLQSFSDGRLLAYSYGVYKLAGCHQAGCILSWHYWRMFYFLWYACNGQVSHTSIRDHSGLGLSEDTVSHWLRPYPEWSLQHDD